MQKNEFTFAKRLRALGNMPFGHGVLMSLLTDYRRPNDKIASWLAGGGIVALRRGLYVLGQDLRDKPVSMPLVANLLYGPSYVSLDFALSHHGLIPEGVATVMSVTTRRTRVYTTPLGLFSYAHLPPALYSPGICQAENSDGTFYLLATPAKALCDKVVQTRKLQATSVRAMQQFLLDDLRIDPDALRHVDVGVIAQCAQVGYKVRHLQALQKAVEALR